jgi:DNA-directed RNA polymerase subunit RPC12/RpoP
MANTNCLEGIRCPKCGHEDSFKIEATVLVLVTDDGTEDLGNSEWDADRYCECDNCRYAGTIKDFSEPAAEQDKLAAINVVLLGALIDRNGDRPPVRDGMCFVCGREYFGDDIPQDGMCPSDDCPHTIARAAIAKARGEA